MWNTCRRFGIDWSRTFGKGMAGVFEVPVLVHEVSKRVWPSTSIVVELRRCRKLALFVRQFSTPTPGQFALWGCYDSCPEWAGSSYNLDGEKAMRLRRRRKRDRKLPLGEVITAEDRQ